MATIKQYEDLIAWQRARQLVRFVYDISKSRHFEMDRGLQDQIRRAAVSVMSNIAEGFDRGTKQEFLNYLFIAKGSCGEVKTQIYIAHDVGYIENSTFRNGIGLCDEVSRLLQSFIGKLKSGGLAGEQRKPGIAKTDRVLEEIMEEGGYEMTPQGMKKKAQQQAI
jgi:four helix bundle protein